MEKDKAVSSGSVMREHLAAFDALDFEVFTHQQWTRLHESHAEDIVVHWPDGHQEVGVEQHVESLGALFVYAPDTRIEDHLVKMVSSSASASRAVALASGGVNVEEVAVGSGEWTCVIGIMKGTFTEPMPMPDGHTLPPTGKVFVLPMCTVGRWTNGVMVEEWLFWDNATYMSQLGASK